MGGHGGGRFLDEKKTCVEACLGLDLRQLVLLQVVQPGVRRHGTICWPAGPQREYPSMIGYWLDTASDTPWLTLVYGKAPDEPTPATHIPQVRYRVPLAKTQQHYGNSRWWLTCPLVFDDRTCAKRVQTLYLPPGATFFGCRSCHALTYASRQRGSRTSAREWPAITVVSSE